MIIAKRLSVTVLALLLCLTAVSCSTRTDPQTLSTLPSGTVSEDPATPEVGYDYVIVPETASDVLVDRARALTNALSAQTGISSFFFFDNETLPARENVRLILLGNTASALSQKHLHDLRRDDYLCAIDEGALILGGKSDAATVAAIDRFSSEILPYADAEILLNPDRQFLVRAEYPVESVTLNGFSLGDYRIVYPHQNTLGEAQVAAIMRDVLADRCGLYPEIVPDNGTFEHTRLITVGACFGNDTGSEPLVALRDTAIALDGATQNDLCVAAQTFCDYVLPDGAPREVVAVLSDPLPVDNTPHTTSSFIGLLCESNFANVIDIARLTGQLKQEGAAFAPFSPVDETTRLYLQLNLPEYACLSLSLADGRMIPLFYREDTLTLLEQKAVGTAHILRFGIRESDVCFTVIHAAAETEVAVKQILEQRVSDNEPTFLFLATPTSLPLADTSETAFREPYELTRVDIRMQILVSLPASFAQTEITTPSTENPTYTFAFPHPFLRK